MRSTKFWFILLGTVLVLSAALTAALYLNQRGDMTAEIIQDGVCIRTIDLSRVEEPYSFTVEWGGGYNTVEVERGRIRVSEADCPDQVCVRRGWSAQGVGPIACLPHKLVIRLSGGTQEVDGAAG